MARAIKPKKRGGPRAPAPAEPRRHPQQERGERRVEEILDAAAAVIAEVGMEAATTNAIAQRAGSSMGSLYHFFPNKDAIVRGLAARYEAEMQRLNQVAMQGEALHVPIPAMVDGIVTPLTRFMERNPAYMPVYYATRDPRKPGCGTEELSATIVGLVERLMDARGPAIPRAERHLQATMAVELVHRMLEYAWLSAPAERPGIVRELKRMLALYSEMVATGTDPLALGPGPIERGQEDGGAV
jgi:AcrR family transcriptional regulator